MVSSDASVPDARIVTLGKMVNLDPRGPGLPGSAYRGANFFLAIPNLKL